MFNNFVNKFKKFLSVFVSLCILTCFVKTNNIIFSLSHGIANSDSEKALVPDDYLREAIKNYLVNKNIISGASAEFKAGDMSKITSLNVQFVGNLTGIENCTALEDLTLELCRCADFSPLSNLKNLKKVYADYEFDDPIEVKLDTLPDVENLEINGCNFTQVNNNTNSYSKLKNLKIGSWRSYNMEVTQNTLDYLGDIQTLEKLTFERRVINGNFASSDSKFSNLKVLEFDRRFDFTKFNFSSLPKSVQEISITSCDIADINLDFSLLNKLETLKVLGVKDFSRLKLPKSLVNLDLSYGEFKNIPDVSGLPNLKKLNLDYNKITDASGLKNLNSNIEVSLKEQVGDMLEPILVKSGIREVTFTIPEIIGKNGHLLDIKSVDDGWGQGAVPFEYDKETRQVTCDLSYIYDQLENEEDEFQVALVCSFEDGDNFSTHVTQPVSNNLGGVEMYLTGMGFNGPYFSYKNRTYARVNYWDRNVWLREESEGTRAWYGLKLPENYDVPSDTYFYVEWVPYEQLIDMPEYQNLDESVRLQIDNNRGWLFYAGLVDGLGNKIDVDFGDEFAELYVQIGDDWNLEDLKSVYVTNNKDEHIEVSSQELEYPGGKDTFGVLKLKHFSPYFIYDSKDIITDNASKLPTGDFNSNIIMTVSSVILVLALGALFLIFKNKKRN